VNLKLFKIMVGDAFRITLPRLYSGVEALAIMRRYREHKPSPKVVAVFESEPNVTAAMNQDEMEQVYGVGA
jgi:hypothetical protein